MSLQSAGSYNAALLARLPTATDLGHLAYAESRADASDDVRSGMPPSLSDEQATKFGNSVLPGIRACLTAMNFGQFIVDILADVDVLPNGTPAMAAGGDNVTGKGKLT